MRYILLMMGATGCAGDLSCGAGTHDEDGECVADAAVFDSGDADADTDADSDADGDTDTDTDTDTDGDTDTDTDTDTTPEPIARWTGDYHLDDSIVLNGVEAAGLLGIALAAGQDVTGDGVPDAVAGAPYVGGSNFAGAVYVAAGPFTTDQAFGEPGATISGADYSDFLGASVEMPGDLNGDGVGDLVVSAPTAYWGGSGISGPGSVYVFLGPVAGDLDVADADVVWTGEGSADQAGTDLVGLGDQDGDGRDEFAVAAKQNFTVSSGAVYVITGGTTAGGSLGGADVRIYGDGDAGSFGMSIYNLGDLNGDGLPDLGVVDQAGGGNLKVFFSPITDGLGSDYDTLIVARDGLFGQRPREIANLGDTDADGYDDLGLGAPGSYVDGVALGSAWVMSGAELGVDADVLWAMARIDGADPGALFGSAVAGPGDMDGDGFGDMVVGEEANSMYAYACGAATVWYGPFSGNLDSDAADARFGGAASEQFAGGAIVAPGDVTGDGLTDLLVGARLGDGEAESSGVVYVIAGE